MLNAMNFVLNYLANLLNLMILITKMPRGKE